VKFVGEYVNEGGRKSFIEMGIETASASIIERYMKGKAYPYRPSEYPEIVERAIGILNDNNWIVVGTMIVNFPGENEDDIMANIELLDRIKNLNVVTFPLPLIPVAAFRKKGMTALDEILEDPLKKYFILKALLKAFDNLSEGVRIVAGGIKNPLQRLLVQTVGISLLKQVRGRYEQQYSKLPAITSCL